MPLAMSAMAMRTMHLWLPRPTTAFRVFVGDRFSRRGMGMLLSLPMVARHFVHPRASHESSTNQPRALQAQHAAGPDEGPRFAQVRATEDGIEVLWRGDDQVAFFHYEWLHR